MASQKGMSIGSVRHAANISVEPYIDPKSNGILTAQAGKSEKLNSCQVRIIFLCSSRDIFICRQYTSVAGRHQPGLCASRRRFEGR